MTKPVVILDPDWRRMDELFSEAAQDELAHDYDVVWGGDGAIPDTILNAALSKAHVLIAATPRLDAQILARAPQLHTVIEVSGAFPATIDYDACFASGVEVLSCAPGFRQSVAEMGLAMALAGARGLVAEHEAFRLGKERWLSDNPVTDFTIYGAKIGFIGFGQIAQELMRLLAPFGTAVSVSDPWLPDHVAESYGVSLASLDEVLATSRCLFVTAVPTSDNYHLLDAARLAQLQDNALLILLSRAHLVDFAALSAELDRGRIQACVDVFPTEPLPQNDVIRQQSGAILSPHRAAAVDKGRQLIGDMILADLRAKAAGDTTRQLSKANANTISVLAGIGDAEEVADMAKSL